MDRKLAQAIAVSSLIVGTVTATIASASQPTAKTSPVTLAQTENRQQSTSQYPNLDGSWNDSRGTGAWRIQHDSASSQFTVFLPNRRGPYAGKFIGQNEIAVEFTDDPGCCTGVLTPNGRQIRWSNGAVWRR